MLKDPFYLQKIYTKYQPTTEWKMYIETQNLPLKTCITILLKFAFVGLHSYLPESVGWALCNNSTLFDFTPVSVTILTPPRGLFSFIIYKKKIGYILASFTKILWIVSVQSFMHFENYFAGFPLPGWKTVDPKQTFIYLLCYYDTRKQILEDQDHQLWCMLN